MAKRMNIQLFGKSDDGANDTNEPVDLDYDESDDYEYLDDELDDTGEDADPNYESDGAGSDTEATEPDATSNHADIDIEAIRREAYERGIREGRVAAFAGKKNEYTGAAIKDEYDLEVYETMRKIEAAGGDPLNDFAAAIAEKRRQESQAASERVEAENKYRDELIEFRRKMPNVDLKELFGNEKFRTFARGKLGNMSLSEVYADYSALALASATETNEKAKRIVAKQKSSPGSLTGKGVPPRVNENEIFERMLHGELD